MNGNNHVIKSPGLITFAARNRGTNLELHGCTFVKKRNVCIKKTFVVPSTLPSSPWVVKIIGVHWCKTTAASTIRSHLWCFPHIITVHFHKCMLRSIPRISRQVAHLDTHNGVRWQCKLPLHDFSFVSTKHTVKSEIIISVVVFRSRQSTSTSLSQWIIVTIVSWFS